MRGDMPTRRSRDGILHWARQFQSSEDAWGHANVHAAVEPVILGSSFNHPKMRGDMPTGCRLAVLLRDQLEFQSSEDAWGHANMFTPNNSAAPATKFQSSEDAWGHANTTAAPTQTPWVITFQSSEDAWGHANLNLPCECPSGDCRFNHPKMRGDMPTQVEVHPVAVAANSFNHPKMRGDMPTSSLTPDGRPAWFWFQSSEDAWGHANVPHPHRAHVGCVRFNHPKMRGDMPTNPGR